MPLAIAPLIAFALSPLVSGLRRRGLPHTLAVPAAVAVAFAVLGSTWPSWQASWRRSPESLLTFQSDIIPKLNALQTAEGSSGVSGRLVDMLTRINDEIGTALSSGAGDGAAAGADATPMQVAVIDDQSVCRWRRMSCCPSSARW